MIKANELRIGNWIKRDENEYEQVDGHFLSRDMTMSGISEVEGIDLTPEILEKAGFELMWEGRWQKCLVDIERTQFGFVLLNGEERSAWAHSYLFLHELQNLYFALTGEELTIQL